MRKKIGIVGSLSDGIFGVPSAYMQWASQFGDVIILTPDMGVLDLDLLILRGGADISPTITKDLGYKNGLSNPYLDSFFTERLHEYMKKGTPIFGICRGLQEINVYFGGKLVQHAPEHPVSNNRTDLVHELTYIYGYKGKKIKVNSLHHQIVTNETLAEKLFIVASTDHNVEALAHSELPIIAVQWHPEEIYDELSIGYVHTLLERSRKAE